MFHSLNLLWLIGYGICNVNLVADIIDDYIISENYIICTAVSKIDIFSNLSK